MTKYLIMDVDGTLTDGKIYVGGKGELMKAFNIKDGYGIAYILPQLGIAPVIITGRSSEIVTQRCRELNIKFCFQGVKDKLLTLKDFVSQQGVSLAECAYIGDDLNDMPCMKAIKDAGGLVACPSDAAEQVRKYADHITASNGGGGAVRDFIDNCLIK